MRTKGVRDAAVVGAPTALIMAALDEYGVPPATATVVAIGVAYVISVVYRALRDRWPWLMTVDAPSGAK